MMSTQIQNSSSRPRNNRRPNHIPNNSNRSGFSNANSHRRDTPENETSLSSNCKGISEDPRTAMMMCTVLGAHSTVKTRNGNRYKGHTTGFSERGDIAMVDAKLEVEDNSEEQHIPGIVIPKANFVVCITNGVDIKGLSIGSADFTDAGITSRVNGSSQVAMKELQPWQDEDADITTSMALDDDQTGGWEPKDMFQENKDKFNVKSSYHDDLRGYTTELPDPTSAGYEERRRFAERKAEEIEKSEVYRSRIAKENEDGDEEAKFSSVHRNEKESGVNRGPDGHTGPPIKATYTPPALRGPDADHMRNGGQSRQTGRPAPRQNSPNFPHQPMHNSRQQHIGNHYTQGPPMPNRNQRQLNTQSPNHGPVPHPHHHPHSIPQPQPQAPPLSQAPLQQQHHHQQQSSRPIHPQSKPNLPPHPNVPSLNQHQQHMTAQKIIHPQNPMQDSKVPLHSSQQQPPPSRLPHPQQQQHMNGGKNGQHISEMPAAHNNGDRYGGVSSNPTAAPIVHSSSKAPEPVANSAAPVDHNKSVTVTATPVMPQSAVSPPTVPGTDKRNGRGQEAAPEENRNNKVKDKVLQLVDFKNKFVLDDSTKNQESTSESTEDNSKSSTTSSGIGSVIGNVMGSESGNEASCSSITSSASSNPASTEQLPGSTVKATEKSAEVETSKSEPAKSTLNPYAAEFKPKVQPAPVEAQPSPPPLRVSPQVLPPYPNMHWLPTGITYPARTKSVLPVGRDLTAQVTGQPLLAHHHGQHMIYMPQQGQSYQVYNTRMVAPNSFPASQAGQQGGLDQSSPQPPQVFVASQQQLVPTPMPAHLAHHPQPAHGQPMPNPGAGQQPQPAHIPNPAPSPVQQQQHQQQSQSHGHGGQPMSHPMPQGPPQSVTPQPAHYPHMNLQPGIQAMPRTSSGQHMAAGPGGHPSVSINYPLQQYSYPNASSAQTSFVHSPQPQMSQSNSHHTPGHQPQYVVMPQPQAHNPMQHIQGQPYSQPIQFQHQQNLMHGPPQMPPTVHSHNHNQGTANFIPSGVQGMPAGLQQVPGALMPMQSQLQPYQPQP